jgi:thiol-disulfide isomerase/thioredoxin
MRSILVCLVAIAIVGLAACDGPAQDLEHASGNEPADFEITVYQGEDVLGGPTVKLSEVLAQGKPVVLNMWAGLCPVCRIEMPVLQEAHVEYGDRVLILGVDLGPFTGLGTEDDARALIAELGITFPTGNTLDASVLQKYQVVGIPTAYFVTPDGEIVQRWSGALTEEQLGEYIDALIQSSRAP